MAHLVAFHSVREALAPTAGAGGSPTAHGSAGGGGGDARTDVSSDGSVRGGAGPGGGGRGRGPSSLRAAPRGQIQALLAHAAGGIEAVAYVP